MNNSCNFTIVEEFQILKGNHDSRLIALGRGSWRQLKIFCFSMKMWNFRWLEGYVFSFQGYYTVIIVTE